MFGRLISNKSIGLALPFNERLINAPANLLIDKLLNYANNLPSLVKLSWALILGAFVTQTAVTYQIQIDMPPPIPAQLIDTRQEITLIKYNYHKELKYDPYLNQTKFIRFRFTTVFKPDYIKTHALNSD